MRLPIVLAALSLSGCAATSYCTGEQDYQKAKSVEPIKSVENTQVPQSPSALRIPEPPADTVPYGETYQDAEGDKSVRCLDAPPPLQPSPAPVPQPAVTPAT